MKISYIRINFYLLGYILRFIKHAYKIYGLIAELKKITWKDRGKIRLTLMKFR